MHPMRAFITAAVPGVCRCGPRDYFCRYSARAAAAAKAGNASGAAAVGPAGRVFIDFVFGGYLAGSWWVVGG